MGRGGPVSEHACPSTQWGWAINQFFLSRVTRSAIIRDGMIQAPSVSMYHVKSIAIRRYITA